MPTPLTDADKVIRNDTGKAIVAAIEALAAPEADHVSYDNTSSGLTADNAQDAIDELKTKNDTKMDKADPTGAGILSINRKAGTPIGDRSGTVGTNNTASGESSFAEGNSNTASGIRAHAEGSSNTASGDYSHVEGAGSTASGERSHAEGSGTTASKFGAHAEGDTTVASGDNGSHAEGYHTTSEGRNSHSEGRYTIANHRSQHVFGEYNDPDPSSNLKTARGNYIEIVGKGSNDENRSNARTLDWNGNEVLAGDLTINGTDKIQAMVALEVMPKNTTKTYTIPSQIYNGGGIYLLAFNNLYHAGGVYILSVGSSSGGDKIKITTLVTSSYLTVTAVAANQFSVTAGNSDFNPCLTRIA